MYTGGQNSHQEPLQEPLTLEVALRTPYTQIDPDTIKLPFYDLAEAMSKNSERNFQNCQLHLRQVASSQFHIGIAIPAPPSFTVPRDSVDFKRFICLFQHRVPCRCDQRLNILKPPSVSRTACRPMRIAWRCIYYRVFK